MKRAALILAAALALSGCGASHSSRSERAQTAAFSGALNQLCKTFTLKSAALGTPKTVQTLVLVMNQLVPASKTLLQKAERLHPPASMRASFRSFLKLNKRSLTLSTDVLTAAEQGNYTEMDTLIKQNQALNAPSDADVRRLHAHWCLSSVTGPPKKRKKNPLTIAV